MESDWTAKDLVTGLSFGKDDAESDQAAGLLDDGFLRTLAFDAASNGEKTLIIGRKGSGKSAIRLELEKAGKSHGATSVTPDDAAGEELRRFELRGVTDETAKSLIWRYVFLVHLARYLVGHAKPEHRKLILPGSVRALRSFLKANSELDDKRLYDRLTKGIAGLQGSLSLEAFGVKLNAEKSATASSEGARAGRQLDVLEEAVSAAARDLSCQAHPPMLLLVDQLEQIWANDADSKATVIGLLLAGKRLNSIFPGIARCVLFLRSDIYDMLQFSDGDKFHGDEMRIEWSPERLSELAVSRAAASLGQTLTEEQFWRDVMPFDVEGQSCREYVLSRALPRPRDVIQFLNLSRDRALGRRSKRIEVGDVWSATVTFSQWKLGDLAKEYLASCPYLSQIYLLFQGGGYLVTRASIRKRFDPVRPTLLRQFPGYADSLAADVVVNTLYSIGFLGVRRNSDVEFAGGHHVALQPGEDVFEIHPCFRPALNALKETPLATYDITVAQARGVQIGTYHVQSNLWTDHYSHSRHDQDRVLLTAVHRSCDRILARLGRANVPSGIHEGIVNEVTQLITRTQLLEQAIDDGRIPDRDPTEHTYRAVDYFDRLAQQLANSDLLAAGNVDYVADILREQSRELRGVLRGSLPGGGASIQS